MAGYPRCRSFKSTCFDPQRFDTRTRHNACHGGPLKATNNGLSMVSGISLFVFLLTLGFRRFSFRLWDPGAVLSATIVNQPHALKPLSPVSPVYKSPSFSLSSTPYPSTMPTSKTKPTQSSKSSRSAPPAQPTPPVPSNPDGDPDAPDSSQDAAVEISDDEGDETDPEKRLGESRVKFIGDNGSPVLSFSRGLEAHLAVVDLHILQAQRQLSNPQWPSLPLLSLRRAQMQDQGWWRPTLPRLQGLRLHC